MRIGILEPKDFSKKAVDMLNSIGEVTLFDGEDLDKYIADKEIYLYSHYRIESY